MQITKIEKKKRLYLLELDGSEELYVTEDTVVRFMLSKGKEVSPEELEEIKHFAQLSYGKNAALYHLSFKQRTVKEVRDYLLKREIDDKIAEEVIDGLKADKWLDDSSYAENYIRQKIDSGDKGPQVIRQKLIQKGIAASLLDSQLAQFDFEGLLDRLAQKTLSKYEGRLPIKALRDKVTQTLMNKGFSYQQAKSALTRLTIDKNEETEQELIFKELDKLYDKYSRKYEGYELKQRLTQALARKGYDYSDIKSALREYC